ncbi:hypothetical protein C2I33_21755 [Ralstonia solanacearum]|nr:hypothetical protein C2I33_21755 [Ralstonia solanacearum]
MVFLGWFFLFVYPQTNDCVHFDFACENDFRSFQLAAKPLFAMVWWFCWVADFLLVNVCIRVLCDF